MNWNIDRYNDELKKAALSVEIPVEILLEEFDNVDSISVGALDNKLYGIYYTKCQTKDVVRNVFGYVRFEIFLNHIALKLKYTTFVYINGHECRIEEFQRLAKYYSLKEQREWLENLCEE